jgi:hypothetical protein
MQRNADAYQVAAVAGDDGNTMCHTSAVVEEVRPIVDKVHIGDAGVGHP